MYNVSQPLLCLSLKATFKVDPAAIICKIREIYRHRTVILRIFEIRLKTGFEDFAHHERF